ILMTDQSKNDNINTNQPPESNEGDWNYQPASDGAIQIPVRVKAKESTSPEDSFEQLRDEDEVVREYEERYYGPRQREGDPYGQGAYPEGELPPRKSKQSWQSYWDTARDFRVPSSHRYASRANPHYVEDGERLWAMLAHASALLTVIALFSSGVGVLFTLLIPLGIYLVYRRRSEFVAHHALQAFTMQTVCTIGVFVIAVIGTLALVAGILVAAIFSIILIGIPFLVVFALLIPVVWILAALTPFVMLIYSMIAANAAWGGRNYRYPYVADWVDDQLLGGRPRATVA
ncbi:MAG: DUF4870 domain-containing protein, partial [Chloroflexi bacterium]|nr:DUF4870 domain-containing protein [Chloroflexota bacterium]